MPKSGRSLADPKGGGTGQRKRHTGLASGAEAAGRMQEETCHPFTVCVLTQRPWFVPVRKHGSCLFQAASSLSLHMDFQFYS